MHRSASSDAIVSQYLSGEWPRSDTTTNTLPSSISRFTQGPCSMISSRVPSPLQSQMACYATSPVAQLALTIPSKVPQVKISPSARFCATTGITTVMPPVCVCMIFYCWRQLCIVGVNFVKIVSAGAVFNFLRSCRKRCWLKCRWFCKTYNDRSCKTNQPVVGSIRYFYYDNMRYGNQRKNWYLWFRLGRALSNALC